MFRAYPEDMGYFFDPGKVKANRIKIDIQEMNVLSLFDGISCGRVALERAGIPVTSYRASEIDRHAISVAQHNWPDTIHVGDVREMDISTFPRIDMLIGGSPCQSFSFAGQRAGMATKCNVEITSLNQYLQLKSEGFQFEGQSYLFWEFVYAKERLSPTYFLLENVLMDKKWEAVITKALGVNPIMINSALVSAQNRERLYWTNIGMAPVGLFGDMESIISQPSDRKIRLSDIIEPEVDAKYFLTEKAIGYLNRTEMNRRFMQNVTDKKAGCVTANYHKGVPYNVLCVVSRGRNPNHPTSRETGLETVQHLEPRFDGKTNTLTTVQKDNYVVIPGTWRTHNDGKGFRKMAGDKSGTVTARATEDGSGQPAVQINNQIRRLTPLECERLQTLPEGYTEMISDTQRYKTIGNGWTVDVISHILSYLKTK